MDNIDKFLDRCSEDEVWWCNQRSKVVAALKEAKEIVGMFTGLEFSARTKSGETGAHIENPAEEWTDRWNRDFAND